MMMSLEDYAKESTRRIPNFAYFGERDLFGTWGIASVGGVHRDSKPLEQSNWAVISEDLLARFPDDCEAMRCSHCMVGWSEELIVKVYADDGSITDAFKACVDWAEKLELYPVANDDDYSEREYDDLIETLTNCYDIPADSASDFAGWADYSGSEELEDEQVMNDYKEFLERT